MRWLHRCWHVTSRTFDDDDDDGGGDDDDAGGVDVDDVVGPGLSAEEDFEHKTFARQIFIHFICNLF